MHHRDKLNNADLLTDIIAELGKEMRKNVGEEVLIYGKICITGNIYPRR